jgi:hypothetical membrane protein
MVLSQATFLKFARFTGILAAIVFLVVIFASKCNNPWFTLTKHAFSDLGGPSAENPWIFNNGLEVTGLLALVYSITLIVESKNKVETVGGAFMFTAAIFLALIGLYPSGTPPHSFISTWFFAQADLAIATWGIGLVLRGRKSLGILSTAIGIFGPLSANAIRWPSTAALEAYGIFLIDVWVFIMQKVHKT